MSAVLTFVRGLNFTSMTTPAVLRGVQDMSRKIGAPEAAAAARWGVAAGLTLYWFIEPNFVDAPPAPAAPPAEEE